MCFNRVENSQTAFKTYNVRLTWRSALKAKRRHKHVDAPIELKLGKERLQFLSELRQQFAVQQN